MENFSVWGWKKSEILFVTGVLLVITGLSWYQIKIGEMKTRDSQRMQDVERISRAIRNYYYDYNIYPAAATGEGKLVACGNMGREVCEWGKSSIVDKDNVVYLNLVPADPLAPKGYQYLYEPDKDRQHFKIYIALEYRMDPRFKPNLTTLCAPGVPCGWYVQE